VFVGSTKEQFEKYKEYMQPFASTVRHIGEIPAGSILKVFIIRNLSCNILQLGMNQMVLSTVTNFATTMAYMKKSGKISVMHEVEH
jgi:3-hydroxyisobutyrate dehydrogenase-like beta-hydroxyacid dehydrogenase